MTRTTEPTPATRPTRSTVRARSAILPRVVRAGLATLTALVGLAASGQALVPGVHPITLLTGGDGDYVRLDDLLRPLGGRRSTDHWLGRSRIEVAGRDVSFLAGTALVVIDGGPPRMLSRPVRDEGGHTWVPVEFVTEILPPVVSGSLTLTGGHLFVDTEPGRLDSVTVATVGHSRAVSLHGRFPAGSVVEVAPGTASITLPGCFDGPDQLPGAAVDDSLLTGIAVVDGRHGLEVRMQLGREITGYSPRQESRSEIALLFGDLRDGLTPVDPAPAPARGDVRRVVLDASHGGLDTGVRTRGLEEKWLGLELARTLADSLRAQGFEVFMTRNEDRDLLPESRASFANEIDGDLFLSFGVEDYGAVRTPSVRCLVHAPVAAPEGSEVVAGYRLVRWEAAQAIHVEESRSAARWILRAVPSDGGPVEREPDAAPLRSFEGLDMPAVMVLLGPGGIHPDRWREGRERLASHLVDAVLGYAGRERVAPVSPYEGFGDPRDGRRSGDGDLDERERDRDRRQAERDRQGSTRDDRRPRPRGRGR